MQNDAKSLPQAANTRKQARQPVSLQAGMTAVHHVPTDKSVATHPG
jgi:hypothetical protein